MSRELWRVIHEQDLSGVVTNGGWSKSVTDSPDRSLAIERLTEKVNRVGSDRIRNVRLQHVRETILSEETIGATNDRD